MFKKEILLVMVISCLVTVLNVSNAANIIKVGVIERVLVSSVSFGGCMIKLDSGIGGNCTNSGWVSLDCDGNHIPAQTAKLAYSSALVAASLKQNIQVVVDDTKLNGRYCVAKRLDVIFE